MSDRLQEIRARLEDCRRRKVLSSQYPADIAWLLDEVERLRDNLDRNYPWWRRDADGSLWAAPPTPDGAPDPDDSKWVRIQ